MRFECFAKPDALGKVETLSGAGQASSKLHQLGELSPAAKSGRVLR